MHKSLADPAYESPILTVHIEGETDFLLARQRAKQIARLLHFELQDQTRIATAVSEIARNAFEYARSGRVEFLLDRLDAGATLQLRIRVSDRGPGIPNLDDIWSGLYKSPAGMGLGLIGARRLMDSLDVDSTSAGTTVFMTRRLPRHAPAPPSLAELSTALTRLPIEQSNVLVEQNQELLRLLSDLRSRESELRVLNEELAETNRGVLVLYAELEDKARAVQQASETKTRFLSGVTHELRTPLNSIVSLSRLMLSYSDGPLTAEQEKQANFILRSAQNLTEMVNDLLDLARLEAGKAQTRLTHFTVAELYTGLRGMFRPLATNPAVTLTFEIPAAPLPLYSDEGKLAQILRNFISNALKFTESGSVTVTAHPHSVDPAVPSALITFSVADTGVGIAPEHHDLVMQEWGQVPGQQPAIKQKGSGLGLPLSRSLAELLGGHIEFTSTPGTGSAFHVTLPALELQPQPTPPAGQGPAPEILIADADEVARYLLRRQLAVFTSASLVEVSTVQQLIFRLDQHNPEILFLDLYLPGLPWQELVHQLRSRAATATLPIALSVARPLSAEEQQIVERHDLTIVPKRPGRAGTGTSADVDDASAVIERALLQVGLSNRHQDLPSAEDRNSPIPSVQEPAP